MSQQADIFRVIEKGLKQWAQHCKDLGILPIETILGEDNQLQHALTHEVLKIVSADQSLGTCNYNSDPHPKTCGCFDWRGLNA